jgi:hypothetical protein
MRPWKGKRTRGPERVGNAGEADERVLEHLARLGCDPAAPRETHHFLYLPAERDAEAVAHVLDADGWSTTVEQSEGAWPVVATRARTLTVELVHEHARVSAARLRRRLYDGWEPTA